ncbi:MAG: phenylalanine--tRNA ligase subunit beta [Candidatus Woesearchaeota archaeon]|nr:phenylalanine--tRNA ligase subunit beta [Candidatus Woesearchaeota archaeon]
MPTVTLNRNVFEKLVSKKLPLEKLKERISMIGTDLESVTDTEIHVEVFPNRPDWLSEQGFARSFSAFIGEKTGLREYMVKKSGLKVVVDKSVAMRPYTACAIVKKLSFNDERIREIMQVQEKLATTHGRNRKKSAYGLYPLNTINFPIQYIAKDPHEVMFQPLGFPKKIPASDVEELHPKGKEYKHIAQGWKKYPFFIDNKNNVLSMLPYTNSNDTGKIDETTTEVFIECTGTDWNNVSVALNIFVTTLADMGGEIYSMDIVYPDKTVTTPDLTPEKMKVDLPYINKRLGLTLKEKEIKELLERMGFGYEKGNALIPAYRADIIHSADLVEDVAIAYGYENFEEKIPAVATIAEEDSFEVFKTKVVELLIGLGLLETKSYSLIDESTQTAQCLLAADEKKVVSIIDPVSLEYNSLRFWLAPSILQVLQRNIGAEYPQRVFEIGRVFKHGDTETGVEETERVCIATTHGKADFTEIKQIVEYLLSQFGLKGETRETEHGTFIPGRVGRVRVSGVDIVYVGEIHPEVLNKFKLENPVALCELNLTELYKILKR